MKISRLEFIVILLATVFLAFSAGWFLRGGMTAGPVQVEVNATRTAPPVATPMQNKNPENSAAPEKTVPSGKININTADSEALQTLPGIGEKRAADIIAYRTEHGPFRIPEDLTKVKGIGEAILAKLMEFITTEEGT